MVMQFITGVIVGVLIGLALAPFVQSWIAWQQAREWEERDATPPKVHTRER